LITLLRCKRLKNLIEYLINKKTKLNNQYIKSVFEGLYNMAKS